MGVKFSVGREEDGENELGRCAGGLERYAGVSPCLTKPDPRDIDYILSIQTHITVMTR